MELRVIDNEESFLKIREKWNNITDVMTDATPFQSWEWNYYWWKDMENGIPPLYILEAFEGRDIFGFAPLVIKENHLAFIGDKHFDYGLFVCAERKREIIDLFFKHLDVLCKEKKLKYFMQCIPVKSDEYGLFRQIQKSSNKTVLREQVETANINLKEYDGFDGYLRAISTSLRKKGIKPCLKAELEFSIENFGESVWSDIEQIYSDRQENRVGVSTLAWARPIVEDMSREGLMKISTLKYKGERVAYLIFYETRRTNYIWLTAFKKTENLQLGHFIRYCVIKRAFENGIERVDMMRGAYDYKKQWDCNETVNYEFLSFHNSFEKEGYLFYKKARKAMRDFVYSHDKMFEFYKKHRK